MAEPSTTPSSEIPTRTLQPDRLRNLAVVCLVAFVIGFIGYFGYALYQIANRDIAGLSAPNDFSVFWAAAKIALAGDPVSAFDVEALNEARNLPPWTGDAGKHMGWHYPPHFHALVLPFGLMSFGAAWLLFSLIGAGAFWVALRWLAGGHAIPIIAGASPAVLMCMIQGQNSLVVAALLAAFLASFSTGRIVLAGLFLGLLTIKPQFGLLLPLALIAAGAWRVIVWGAAATLVIVALTLAWVGTDYWIAFFNGLSVSSEWVESGWLPRHLMITWYAFGVAVGLPDAWADRLQIVAALLTAAAVFWAWRRPGAPFNSRAAALVIAIPLVSPYAYFYDLVLPMIAVALLLANRRRNGDLNSTVVAALLWAAPTLGHFGRELGADFAFALLTAPLLALSLAAVLFGIARNHVSA